MNLSSVSRLTLSTTVLLSLPPLLWAGNAIAGKMMNGLVPPMTLNFLRWLVAFAMLLPLAGWVLTSPAFWHNWRRYALLGLLGIGCYNALQYLALKTSTPLNVTLVAASMPVFMLFTGGLFFGQRVSILQICGAGLSVAGVLVVLARGEWSTLLKVQLVPGDLYIMLAALAWSFYSWQLSFSTKDPVEIRGNWAAFLMAQIAVGLLWSGSFAAIEWLTTAARIVWSWPVVATLLYIAIGPALIAYRCWGLGVQQAGPALAGVFSNLTPLFAALLSAAFLGELPHGYHAIAFVMLVGGIVLSSKK